ncbi:glutamate receptor 4-like [Penaeus vannamei]|uniref:glutamate receptor 4-like n=1 Tax=Penaeus vannamei TaxID=6689 RepID=UPI00387FA8A2
MSGITLSKRAFSPSPAVEHGAHLHSPARRVPFGDSVRIVSGLWLLVCLILASVYRSNLKAMLILPKVTVPFDSLEQLVKTDLPVWVAPQSVLYNVAMTGKCANYLMSEAFLKSYMLSIIFPKGSPLKKKVDKVIVSLREAGILDHLYKKGVSNATECLKPITTKPSQEVRTLDIGDVYGVFLVYLGDPGNDATDPVLMNLRVHSGMVLAILVFALELLAAIMGRQPRLLDISSAPPVLKG